MTLEKAYNKPWKFLDWRFCCSCSEKYFFQQVCIKKAPNQFSFSISASLWTSQKRPQDRWMGNWVSRNWKNSNYCKEGTWGKVKKANVITCSYYVLSKSGSVQIFEFLRPFSKATEETEITMFCFGSDLYWIENKKFVYNNQPCFAFQIQTLTTSWRILTLLSPSFIRGHFYVT